MPEPTEPKIIIDTDWKAQAQKEKERLAAKEREAAARQATPRPPTATAAVGPAAAAAPPPAGPAASGGAAGRATASEHELPPADFLAILEILMSQALMYMGAFPDPQTGRPIVSLEAAKFHIDLLGVLEEKTKGNLNEEEASNLAKVLHGLRMQYVELSRAVAQMQARMVKEAQAAAAAGKTPTGSPGLAGLAEQLRTRPE